MAEVRWRRSPGAGGPHSAREGDTGSSIPLTPRELEVFRAIIRHYIRTAEPVGSRAVARLYDLGISPATIRNVMTDLEARGLVRQPHASAGRVPTDVGYRLYVDEVMSPEALSDADLASIEDTFENAPPELRAVLERASAALGNLSAQLAVALHPIRRVDRVDRIHVARLDRSKWLLVVTGRSGAVRTGAVILEAEGSGEGWARAIRFLSDSLVGSPLEGGLGQRLRDRLLRSGLGEDRICRAALRALENLGGTEEVEHIHFGGTGNIMSQPEFRDSERLRGLFEALEAREPLVRIFEVEKPGEPGQVQVTIGGEIPHEGMRDLSLVYSSYRSREGAGSLGVIGPTRMRYERLVSLVVHTAAAVSCRLRRL